MVTSNRKIGYIYEERAANYFQKLNYRILCKNYYCPYGEIDLIVEDSHKVIIFVEVKARRTRSFGNAGESVDRRKKKTIIRCAGYYIYKKGLPADRKYRFDVVLFEKGELIHIEDAFC